MNKLNKTLIAALSVVGMAAAMGTSVGAASLSSDVGNAVAKTGVTQMAKKANYIKKASVVKLDENRRDFDPIEIAKGYTDLGGIHYAMDASGQITSQSPVENPGAVTTLRLYRALGKGYTLNESMSFSEYTGLEDVIAGFNHFELEEEALMKSLPSGTNLYVCGWMPDAAMLKETQFKNLYLVPQALQYTRTVFDTNFVEGLNLTGIQNIYYNDFMETHWISDINAFNAANHTNKLGQTIQMTKLTNCKYPETMFWVYPQYENLPKIFGGQGGYYEDRNDRRTVLRTNYVQFIDSINKKVVNMNLHDDHQPCGFNLDSNHTYGVVTCDDILFNNYSGIKAEEIVIHDPQNPKIDQFKNSKALRFRNIRKSSEVLLSGDTSDLAKLEHIYIPTANKSQFTSYANNEIVGPKIVYYDESTYKTPLDSYKSVDGNEYYVRGKEYTIEELEAARQVLADMGFRFGPEHNHIILEDLLNEYEIPIHDYASMPSEYSLRTFDRICISKTVSLEKVLDAFKDLVLLDHNYMTDASGLTIAISAPDYKPGTSGQVDLLITLPGHISQRVTVDIEVLDTTDEVAFVLDNNDTYIIKNPTTQSVDLKTVLEPLMTQHFKKSTFSVTQSPIYKTNDLCYVAPNSFTSGELTGQAKMFVTNVDIAEAKNPGPVDPEKPVLPDPSAPQVDETGTYVVKEIDKIYTNNMINGTRIPNALQDFMCTKNGEPFIPSFVIAYTPTGSNDKNYQFSMSKVFDNNFAINKNINVEIIKTAINVGFVKFKNGDILMIYNHFEKYTQEQLDAAMTKFMVDNKLNEKSLKAPVANVNVTDVFEGSYDGGKIYYSNSGVNIAYTNPTTPTDQSELKKGYVALDLIVYTDNFTVDEVLRGLAKRILLKDGIHVTDFTVDYKLNVNKKDYNYVIKDSKGTVLKEGLAQLEKVKSEYQYILARPLEFDTISIVIPKQAAAPKYTLSDVIAEGFSHFRSLETPFTTDKTIDFTKEGKLDVDGVHKYAGGNYYNYEVDVEIIDLNKEMKTEGIVIDGKGPKTAVDDVKDWFGNLGENIKNNKAYKATTIILGTITGALLIWGLVVIFRKLHKWLKRR